MFEDDEPVEETTKKKPKPTEKERQSKPEALTRRIKQDVTKLDHAVGLLISRCDGTVSRLRSLLRIHVGLALGDNLERDRHRMLPADEQFLIDHKFLGTQKKKKV